MIIGLHEGLAACAEFWCATAYHLDGPVKLQEVSPMLCALMGYSREQLCSMPVSEFIHPEDMKTSLEARKVIAVAESHSGVFSTRTRWRHRTGRYIAFEWRSTTRDTGYSFHVGRDVTKQRQDMAWDKLQLANMKELATTDTLTGLMNRRMMYETLNKEVTRSLRTGSPLSLAAFDVDHFKHVNDRFGHDVGDEVLRQVADCIRAGVRNEDTAYRPGGEEFAVLLPECDVDGAISVVERVLHSIRNKTNVTASAGVAAVPVHGQSPQTLVKSADQALYFAKHSGRNQARVAGLVLVGA